MVIHYTFRHDNNSTFIYMIKKPPLKSYGFSTYTNPEMILKTRLKL